MIRTPKIWNGFFVLFGFLCISCGKKFKSIDPKDVDAVLLRHVSTITNDFIELVPNDDMWTFKKKGYVTPMVHVGMTSPNGIYSLAPQQLKEELGTDLKLRLIKVMDRKLLYSFSYEVESSLVKDGSKKLMFDINKDYGLAKIHFFVKNEGRFKTNKDWVNLFSDDIFLRN
nr:hypothetical protein [uncultured Allomuricauda sp.]